MSDTPHPRGIGLYRRFATPTSTRAAPSIQANVVWPPPDDEVARVLGEGQPGDPSLAGLPGKRPQPTAPQPGPAANPVTAGGSHSEEPFDSEEETARPSAADVSVHEPAEPSASALALDAPSRSNAGGAAIVTQAERHFSLSAIAKPTISLPVAFSASVKRRGRRVGILGVAAAAVLLLFTLPGTSDVATLVVQSEPAGAMVMVNGVGRGETPYEVQVAPGEYVIELRRGERTWRRPVALRAGVHVVNYFALGDQTAPTTASRASHTRPSADSLEPVRVAKANDAATSPTRPTTVRAVAREDRPAPRVAQDRRRG
ncbi:MAG: PEGA domain-containing protein, partial [Luteitalea sp.]|nr:PEGA domain-containing protein [Luteitalea sp.]